MFFFIVIVASGFAMIVAAYYFYNEPIPRSTASRSFSRGSVRVSPNDALSPLSSVSSTNQLVNHVRTPIPGSKAACRLLNDFGSLTLPAKSPTLVSCCASSVTAPSTANAAASTTSARRRRSCRSPSALPANSSSTALTYATSRLSVCDCRLSEDGEEMVRDDESVATSTEDLHFRTAYTKIIPIQFNRYTPLDLTKMSESDIHQGLCKDARDEVIADVKQTILTPFRPILNSVVYAAKHAFLLGELVNEYEYTDS